MIVEKIISEYEGFFKRYGFEPDMVIVNANSFTEIMLYTREQVRHHNSFFIESKNAMHTIHGMRVVVCNNIGDDEILCVYAGVKK